MATSVPRICVPRDRIGRTLRILAVVGPLSLAGSGCSSIDAATQAESASIRSAAEPATELVATTTSAAELQATTTEPPPVQGPVTRPDWLGQRPLPTTPDGAVVVPQTTPWPLRDRRLPTIDTLPPPSGADFTHSAGPVPDDVLARSTWVEGCPVPVEGLTYLTLSFWGFDEKPHTGEMIVNATVSEDVTSVFRALYAARFPIEEMRVVSMSDLDAVPTGDGNNTTSFVCRTVTGGSSFSQHAHGLAVDLNPFHNPYLRDELLLPELAEAYVDRSERRPGTVEAGDVAVAAFAEIGWHWGGNWRSLKDYQHFSLNNR